VVCLGPRDPVDISGPRPLSDVRARPLNFTVRGQPASPISPYGASPIRRLYFRR
jgi:hypothetical protein